MTRRVTLCLCLFLGLASAPMRLAEAAADLACSLAVSESDQNLEPVDGGVGDEPNDAVLAPIGIDFNHVGEPTGGVAEARWLAGPVWVVAVTGKLPVIPGGIAPRPTSYRARERARLQRFLF